MPPPFEIAPPAGWNGFQLGMTRDQVLGRVQELGLEPEWQGPLHMSILVDFQEMDFWFPADGTDRLCQIGTDHEDTTWKGKPIMGVRLDEALGILAPSGTPVWQTGDGANRFSKEPPDELAIPVPDEALLEEGTVWVLELGLALSICEGEILEIAWRAAQDLPSQFVGPVTPAQRQISCMSDVAEYLTDQRIERNRLNAPKDPLRPLRVLLTLATIATAVWIGWIGFQDMQVWAAAPVLKGNLLRLERGPLKQFLDYLPVPVVRLIPRVIRAGRTPFQTDLFRIEFEDPAGQRREALLEPAEFYVAPQALGEEVEVTYVEGDPPRVKGPARARDSAFIEHVPWIIALGAVYLFAQALISLLPIVFRALPVAWRALRALLPKATIEDPNRPEIR